MSQLYHVQLKTSVSQTFTLSDCITHRIELTKILPEEEMLDILKETLKQNGFEEQENGSYSKSGKQDEKIVFDLDNMEVSASFETEKTLQTEAIAKGQAWDDKSVARQEAKTQIGNSKQVAREQLAEESQKIQKQLSKELEVGEQERMREINQMLQQVYAKSLKQKARQLGDIMDIHESTVQGQYELVIKIEQ